MLSKIPIRHDNVINLIMKITGRIIFKTTFRCPHDTIIRSKYNIQQITRRLMFTFKFKYDPTRNFHYQIVIKNAKKNIDN